MSVRIEMREAYSHIESTGHLERGRKLTRVNETAASTGDLWSPLAYVVRMQKACRGRAACQRVAGRRVEVNMQFSLFESVGENRLVKCMRERDRGF